MQAHANDLRAEVADDWRALVASDYKPTEAELDAFVHRAASDWRACGCAPPAAAMLAYAEKITRCPTELEHSDIERLHGYGWSDEAIHDAVQVVSYFNYINRVADALGVEPEDFIKPWGMQHG